MGANQSSAETRSVSMDNPTPSGVIDVSDEVVQRLKLGISKVKQEENKKSTNLKTVPVNIIDNQKTSSTPPMLPQKSPSAATATIPAANSADLPKTIYSYPTSPSISTPQTTSPSTVAAAAAAAAALRPPYPKLTGEPTVTSMELRRQKETELRENDQFWKARIAQLEANINKTNEVMEKEYTAAIEDVQKRFASATGIYQPPPCQDAKARVIACYRANPNEILKCDQEVANFTNCVAANRIKKLDIAMQQQQQQTPAAKAG